MPHSLPIYLGWAGLLVGGLGLGANHVIGGNVLPFAQSEPQQSEQQQPLFAKSVEEAALPAPRWPTQDRGIAFYDPLIELKAQVSAPPASNAGNQEQPTTREVRQIPLPPQQEETTALPRQSPMAQ